MGKRVDKIPKTKRLSENQFYQLYEKKKLLTNYETDGWLKVEIIHTNLFYNRVEGAQEDTKMQEEKYQSLPNVKQIFFK